MRKRTTMTRSEKQAAIGHRLYILRLENDMSQYDLGKAIGVADSTICRWEQSARYMTVGHLEKLCEVLGCSIEYLVTGKEKQ